MTTEGGAKERIPDSAMSTPEGQARVAAARARLNGVWHSTGPAAEDGHWEARCPGDSCPVMRGDWDDDVLPTNPDNHGDYAGEEQMDPDETLRLIRATIAQMRVDTDPGVRKAHADELAEYVEALDGWLTGGGFRPQAWDAA